MGICSSDRSVVDLSVDDNLAVHMAYRNNPWERLSRRIGSPVRKEESDVGRLEESDVGRLEETRTIVPGADASRASVIDSNEKREETKDKDSDATTKHANYRRHPCPTKGAEDGDGAPVGYETAERIWDREFAEDCDKTQGGDT